MRTVPGFVAAFGAAMGLIAASTQLSLADVPLKGSFLANKECPAFLSFRKGTNPGGAKVESAHSYQLLAKNAPLATNYRVRIENASPPERWVSADCGSLQEENAGPHFLLLANPAQVTVERLFELPRPGRNHGPNLPPPVTRIENRLCRTRLLDAANDRPCGQRSRERLGKPIAQRRQCGHMVQVETAGIAPSGGIEVARQRDARMPL